MKAEYGCMFGESLGRRVAGLPGPRVAESNLIVLQLRLHDLVSPGCRAAESPSQIL